MRARRELLLFGAAYLLYNAGRAVTNGDMDLAIANAGWVLDVEGGASVERSVQDAFGGVWMALLSHIYLAAQVHGARLRLAERQRIGAQAATFAMCDEVRSTPHVPTRRPPSTLLIGRAARQRENKNKRANPKAGSLVTVCVCRSLPAHVSFR